MVTSAQNRRDPISQRKTNGLIVTAVAASWLLVPAANAADKYDALINVFTIPNFTVASVVDIPVEDGKKQQIDGWLADSTPVTLIVQRPGCTTYKAGSLKPTPTGCVWRSMVARFKSARRLGEFFGVEDARRRRFIGNGVVRALQVDHDGGDCRSIVAFLQPDGTVIGRACGSGKEALTEYLSRVSLSRRDNNIRDEANLKAN